MTYFDSITVAAQHAHDRDVPQLLLPLTICNEASMLAGFDSDRIGATDWD